MQYQILLRFFDNWIDFWKNQNRREIKTSKT